MSQVKQILRMHRQGKGHKTITKALGVSKNTVKSYVNKVRAGRVPMASLLAMEGPVLEAALFPGNPAYRDPRHDELKTQLGHYAKELKRTFT